MMYLPPHTEAASGETDVTNTTTTTTRFLLVCSDGRVIAVYDAQKNSKKVDRLCARLNDISGSTVTYAVQAG